MFILLIQNGIRFNTHAIKKLVLNKWINESYEKPIVFTDILKEPIEVVFPGKSIPNSPYWVIRNM